MRDESSNPNLSDHPSDEQDATAESRFRGLPALEDLKALAHTYLEEQHKHWQELAGTPALPEIADASIAAMAEAYSTAYRSCRYQAFEARPLRGKCDGIGAAYIRYSDGGSNPRSLDQQVIKVLRTAREDGLFIPWEYVLGDAAITGTTTARNGYSMLCQLAESPDPTFECVYVDDLDRLHREQVESLNFARQLGLCGRRLKTTSGFDSTGQTAKLIHSVEAWQNEQFIDQLRSKVDRGMTDAFNQGKNVGSLPLGYKRLPRLDSSGQPVIGRKGKMETDVVIDAEAAEVVRRIFRLYSESKMSPARIARLLDQEQVLGKNNWGASAVSTLLRNERYIGRARWKRTRTITNPRTGKKASVPRPASEHLIQEIPAMRIVNDELWQAVRRREKEVSRNTNPKDGSGRSRQSQYPTRLFDLYCQDCGKPLRLAKAGKYAQLSCPLGKDHLRGCTLRASKGLRIIDECVLANLKLRLLKPEAMGRLLQQANAFLAEEAAKPPVDTASIDEKIDAARKKSERLATRLIKLDDGPAADTLLRAIQENDSQLDVLKQQRELADKTNFRPVAIDGVAAEQLVQELRDLVHEDPGAADAILAKSLGRVHIALGEKRGERMLG